MKVALAQMNPIIGAISYNQEKILSFIAKSCEGGADLIVFPELVICGYPPEDLLLLPSFVRAATNAIQEIAKATKGITALVGCIRENKGVGEKNLFNSVAILEEGRILGYQDKVLLPDYDVFSERRYFEPGGELSLWNIGGKKVAITICEDLWQHSGTVIETTYRRDPVLELKAKAPDLLVNLSASPFYLNRFDIRLNTCRRAARTLGCPLMLCNQVGGNDSLIFDGASICVDKGGMLSHTAASFKEELLIVESEESGALKRWTPDPVKELFDALVLGVRDYFHKLGWQRACFGLSGGIDSAVVAVIAKEALGADNILALALPSRYSSPQSFDDARRLAANLGIQLQEISIEKPFMAFLDLLEPHFQGAPFDTTEENLQARIRGMVLMAFSNKFGYLLLSPGNKSEMAMGYATLYGDMCGGLGVLSDVTKEWVYALARMVNQQEEIVPFSILAKPPSAELRENQKDTDTLPDYPIVDKVLEAYVEEHKDPEEIAKLLKLPLLLVKELVRKIHQNEYKRRQAPPGLRVTKKAFTVGRRFPIVQRWV